MAVPIREELPGVVRCALSVKLPLNIFDFCIHKSIISTLENFCDFNDAVVG
jgi:hypothetical protein